jgi:putative endonuclease
MFYLYILTCADGTLYTGIATDVERRVEEHNSANLGAKYTRTRRPVKLSYQSIEFADRSEAAREEYRIKQLSRQAKLDLVKSHKKEARSKA